MMRAKPERKYELILKISQEKDNRLNITWLCEIAGVPRSGYYRWLKAEPIRAAKKANPYRKILRDMYSGKIAANEVNREFREHGARTILLTDITYIKRRDGKFTYLSTDRTS